jgi:hypothetical protein
MATSRFGQAILSTKKTLNKESATLPSRKKEDKKMKDLWLLAIFAVIAVLSQETVQAQDPIKATTFDGKRVLLYSDGTWKPSVSEPGQAAHLGAFNEPRQVTLLSRRMHGDYMKATFSFKFGIRDDPGLKITRNEWDLLFDNGDGGFTVGMVMGDRSRIVDLGEMTWGALTKVPVVRALPEGARAGNVGATQGHMYVVHTVNGSADLYSVFRVDWLEPGNQCVISWVNVPSPEGKSIADRN